MTVNSKKTIKRSEKKTSSHSYNVTVADFERENHVELKTKDKDMKLPEYIAQKGFPSLAKMMTI